MASLRSEPLRAQVIVRPHVQHAADCARRCLATFGCRTCKHRLGACLREPGHERLCQRCARKRREKGGS